jgi:hypothetical protein
MLVARSMATSACDETPEESAGGVWWHPKDALEVADAMIKA